MTGTEREAVLDVTGLEMEFRVGRGLFGARQVLRAVDDVSLSIARGETLALVGESGSGKTTVGRCVVRLLEPTGGSVVLLGRDISRLSRRSVRPLRKQMHIVFQDPYSSLNPRMTIGRIVGGPLANQGVGRRERRTRVAAMLERVGLRPELQDRYPHSLSGGQRQRVAIARALIAGPTLLVADEPISALDASVQASMLNLLVDLQREMHFACLFITHDLSAAQFLADRIAVMYLGQIVESGTREEIFAAPRHPYTQSAAVGRPRAGPGRAALAGTDRPGGRPPEPAGPAVRLPVPSALPDRHRAVHGRAARARGSGRRDARGALPPCRAQR